MKFADEGFPLIVLSHRKREFLPRTLASIKHFVSGIGEVFVVDDSGDHRHREWMADHGYNMTSVGTEPMGYLEAMRHVWNLARLVADVGGHEYVMLWEEDFEAVRPVDLDDLRTIMDANAGLAHLNLTRQPVYRVEREQGYMESHNRRGYQLARCSDSGLPWVARQRPFTTNPGLIRREVLDIFWPTREEADLVEGGAEPAMSLVLEAHEWYFGWYGKWNSRYTQHVSRVRHSGVGY